MTFKKILYKDLFSSYYQQKPWLHSVNSFIREIVKNFHLILLSSAVLLSFSFSVGKLTDGRSIDVRIEDILIIILLLIWLIGFLISGKKKIKKPPLFWPIIFWLGLGLVSTLINWALGYLWIVRAFFYFLKEIEFFIFYFYFFYQLKTINSAKFLTNFLMILILANVFFVFYQIFYSQDYWFGEYGTAALCEWGVFPTGGFFLLSFIFFFNLFLYYFLNLNISKLKKGLLGLVAISPIIGVFGAGSKTVLLATIFILVLTVLLLLSKKRSFKLFLLIVVALIIIINIYSLAVGRISTLARYSNLTPIDSLIANFKSARLVTIEQNLDNALKTKSPLLSVIGLGKGFVTEVHNQYVRNFIETGILGSILFSILIFVIVKNSFQGFWKGKDGFSVGLSAGVLIATLAMLFFSIATEPFIVVKVSEVYWIFMAITMAVLSKNLENRK